MLDVQHIRQDFPILQTQVRGKPLVYLDSAASSQRPRQVVDAMRVYYERDHANVHRGVHTLAERATAAYEGARETVAGFVGASAERLVWTRGTTEAINLVAHGWARKNLREGDRVLLTHMEHHANLVPWQMAAKDTGAVLDFIPLTEDYRLDLSGLDDLITDRTRLVALSHMSNVLGTVNPVRQIADAAHSVGALVLADAAQSVPHMPVDVDTLGVDFLVFSGHKMLGPTGIGALVTRPELLDSMDPFLGGGEMILEVTFESSTYKTGPHKFEAGTPAIAETVGLAAAVDYLRKLGMEAVHEHEEALTRYALDALGGLEGMTVYGPPAGKDRGGAVSFAVEGIHPHDLATILDTEGVAVRAGHHCAQPLMRLLGVPATTRASFYVYNTESEVDALVRALEKARGIFGKAGQKA